MAHPDRESAPPAAPPDLAPAPSPANEQELSHLDAQGHARMVGVGHKPETARTARASGRVVLAESTLQRITRGELPKGDVLQVARLAGIQAAKRTADLIPLCHPLRLTGVQVDFAVVHADAGADPGGGECAIDIAVTVDAFDRTGVEMEALTAVSVAALTIYDMCKAVDRSMRITAVQLEHKSGGRTGAWQREP
jgi:cyclic pyranopterin phosphate synthase